MALWNECRPNANERLGFGMLRCASFGRKRVGWSNILQTNPRTKHCSETSVPSSDMSPFEALPQEILIRILCGVGHDDLRRLCFVSKSFKEATMIAKKLHFTYFTPVKTWGSWNLADSKCSGELNEVEHPNAPKQSRIPRSRLIGKNLDDIKLALFASPDDSGDVFRR